MNLFAAFQTVLYTISTALLYPVVICLLLLCLWLLIYTGGFFAEWIKRRTLTGDVEHDMETIHLKKELPSSLIPGLPLNVTSYAATLSRLVQENSLFSLEKIESLNQKKQLEMFKEVDRIRLIVRIGPSLGLMGTLIPMGTGLAGLTQGNMAQLSSSLILAFTTTVVGLALGITAHFFSVIKEQWAMDDLRQINLITEAMVKGHLE
ncbi:MotA/TolQ/ExbB proton channel family protein [Desulfogranum japonicum]|uniref:MotA/TolQ/ExbB proton channel family protein n=1 Tax=Desulfogranum japonicum TaxID=231447 RepID=UPI0003F4D726|nr:MotA/TolQ/ExbB proton channel family protein [Desulfogranum japonicum]